METKLIYLENMQQYSCEAEVVNILSEEGKTIVVLNQTVFYPQGGGQPYDMGIITAGEKIFQVDEVRFVDGNVRHIGTFKTSPFILGDKVICSIDVNRRVLNSRVHSAGHLLDMAMKKLGITWIPGKGYHFPNGPYVEYAGSLSDIDIEKLKKDLENACNEIIKQNIPTKVMFMKKEEMGSVCDFVPDYVPNDKPGRVVLYGNFGIPDGGTHVSNLSEIGSVIIRKIKHEKEAIRISYNII